MFVPDSLAKEKKIILQLLNAATGKDCSKDPDDVFIDAFLLLTKHGDRARDSEDSWGTWEAQAVKIVPQVETVDTLRSMQVGGPRSPSARLECLRETGCSQTSPLMTQETSLCGSIHELLR